MGRQERVCGGCGEARNEYDDCRECKGCWDDYFDCCAGQLTCYAGFGYVCTYCDNFNGAPWARDEDLLEFLLEKYKLEQEDVYKEWASIQPVQKLPCFKCKETTCSKTHENEIDYELPEDHEEEEEDAAEIFGLCCKCVSDFPKDKWCEACLEPAQKKNKA